MPAKLVVTKGLLLGREEVLQREVVVLGRSASCDLSVPEEQVSRRHAQLALRDGRWHVSDLQSANGTLVNDRRLAEGETARLRLGDRIGLGSAVEFTLMEAIGADLPVASLGAGALPSLPVAEPAPRRTGLWIGIGAAALVLALIAGALIWRNATRTDVAAEPRIVTSAESTAAGVQGEAVAPQKAPADLPAPTPRPSATVAVAAAKSKAAQAGGAPQASQGGAKAAGATGAGMSATMTRQLEQLPALIAQAFPGVPPQQLPAAIAQALQSGQIKPEVAQGFIQALFPGVPPQQLPAALAGSFGGFNIPQIQTILQAIYPGMSFAMPNAGSRAGAIAFAALDDSGSRIHIYQMNADGSDKRVLIEDASEPAFSPDGKRIAYFSYRPDAVGLRIRVMDTGETVNLTSGDRDAYPSWSPDGNRLAFWDLNDNTVVVVNADGNGRRAIARGEFPDWSPRGDRIALKGCVGNDCGIVLVNPDGSNAVRITTNANDGQPAWSPDGRSIAFVSNRDGNWEIYAVNADGSWLRRITDDPHTDGLPAWSADGLRIAFRSDRDGKWAIYTATGVGGPPFRLVDAPVQSSGHWQWTWEQLSWR